MPLTAWQLIRQSYLCHPDWDAETHLGFLEHEPEAYAVDVSKLGAEGETPIQWIERWLRTWREADAQAKAEIDARTEWLQTPVIG